MNNKKRLLGTLLFFSFIAATLFWTTNQKTDRSDEAPKTHSKVEPPQAAPKPPEYVHVQFYKSPRIPASTPQRTAREGTVLYKLKDSATASQKKKFAETLRQFGFKNSKKLVKGKVNLDRSQNLTISEEDFAEALKKTGAVEFAEADAAITMAAQEPKDPLISSQWHHPVIRTFSAWTTAKGEKEVLVASCDTGVDRTHPDLTNILHPLQYNSEDGTNNSIPINSHGTMTTGALAAQSNNRLGIAGVANRVRVLAIKVSNFEDGSAFISSLTNCIEYAADQGAKVVNLSYNGAGSESIDQAAQYLRSKGGLLVVAAGNDGMDNSSNPDFSSFVIVGATDPNHNRPFWSNYGLPVDIVAPGEEIFTTTFEGSYAYASGTSLSAPLVSGVAAMIYSMNSKFTPSEVESLLLSSARPLGSGADDLVSGHGLLDAESAIRSTLNYLSKKKAQPVQKPRKS